MLTSTAVIQLIILAIVIVLAECLIFIVHNHVRNKPFLGLDPTFVAMLSNKERQYLIDCSQQLGDLTEDQLAEEIHQAQIWEAAVERSWDEEEAHILNDRIDKARDFEIRQRIQSIS